MDVDLFYCSDCGAMMLDNGPCRRKNKKGFKLCSGKGEIQWNELVLAQCKCGWWWVKESEIGFRCDLCHRKTERAPRAETRGAETDDSYVVRKTIAQFGPVEVLPVKSVGQGQS